MISKEQMLALKNAGLSFEQVQDLITSEEEFEKTGISYDLDEAFVIIKNNIFSRYNQECTK